MRLRLPLRAAGVVAVLLFALLPTSKGAFAGSVWFDYRRDGATTRGNAAVVDVVVDQSADVTYYAAMVWNTGYMGLQRGGSGFTKHVHFSVWDADSGPQTEVVSVGQGTVTERFGGEGTGYKTMHPFEWQVGVRYRMALELTFHPAYTDYAAFFYDPAADRWTHLATLRRHEINRSIDSFASFVEDFGGTPTIARAASYGNCWVRDLQGLWIAQNQASFFNNSTNTNLNAEAAGGLLRLATGGNTVNNVTQRQLFTLPAGPLGSLPNNLLIDTDGDGLTDVFEQGHGRYEYVAQSLPWPEAKVAAETRGGYLATITTSNELVLIRERFGGSSFNGFHIGGSDSIEEGVWQWVTGEPWNSLADFWWIGNPSGTAPDEDYLELRRLTPAGGEPLLYANDVAPSTAWWSQHFLVEYGNPTDYRESDTDGDGLSDAEEQREFSFRVDMLTSGRVRAWGRNDSGQIGVGSMVNQHHPVRVGVGTNWQYVANGLTFTFGIKADGTLWAWGENGGGQLGLGDTQDRTSPDQVGGVGNWTTVAGGAEHALGIQEDGSLWAWGDNSRGQVGVLGAAQYTSPVRVGPQGNWRSISAGMQHSLAVGADGTLWSWGLNGRGQLGIGNTQDQGSMVRVGADSDWWGAAAGQEHSLAIKQDGSLWAWGRNEFGELGDGSLVDKHVPTRIGSGTNWQNIATGNAHSVASKQDGSLWAWGWNAYGQVGDGTTNTTNVPVQVGKASSWISLAAGTAHSLAVSDAGVLRAWGWNQHGQLGLGEIPLTTKPRVVDLKIGWKQAAAGGLQSAALEVFEPFAPKITTQPTSQTVDAGATVTFQLEVSSVGVQTEFYWFKDGVPLPGATNAMLTIPSVTYTNMGKYWAAINVPGRSIISDVVTLTIPTAFVESGNHYLQTRDQQEYLRIDNASAFNFTNEFSIMFWFRADADQPTNVTSTVHPMVAKWDPHIAIPYPFTVRFVDRRSSTPRRVQAHVWDTVNNPKVSTPANLDTNYHHVAFIRKGSLLMLFYDGVLSDSGVFTIGSVANNNPIYFGRNGGGLLSFRGALDDVQFWNRALSHTEILHLMHNDPNFSDSSLVGFYDFDSTNGVDRSTYGHHATVTGQILPAPAPVLSPELAYGMRVGDFFPTTRYRLQRTDSLSGTPVWMDATNGVQAGPFMFDFIGGRTNRFYRVTAP